MAKKRDEETYLRQAPETKQDSVLELLEEGRGKVQAVNCPHCRTVFPLSWFPISGNGG